MRVRYVALTPTKTAQAADVIALTPELLAATGARYSRNNEGLDNIISKIDWTDTDKSVDSIFKMVDYGHASIADMSPVAIFMDDISIYAAYFLWANAPTAGGQESSTRYIKYSADSIISPKGLNIANPTTLLKFISEAFSAYESAKALWLNILDNNPKILNLPDEVINDESEKGSKKLARLKRNFAFDRARVFLPVAAKTNVMMVNSARSWVELVSLLLSHPLKELNLLGSEIVNQLQLAVPRLVKHAVAKPETTAVLMDELKALQQSFLIYEEYLPTSDGAFLELYNDTLADLKKASSHRINRYSYFGEAPKMTGVRFGWENITFGEIRDLNRHRTGSKMLVMKPNSFYNASDQLDSEKLKNNLNELSIIAHKMAAKSISLLKACDPTYIYFTLLGHTYSFQHITTLDKYIYEAELRTGVGAHYRYAMHLRNTLHILYKLRPELKGVIIEGRGEPE